MNTDFKPGEAESYKRRRMAETSGKSTTTPLPATENQLRCEEVQKGRKLELRLPHHSSNSSQGFCDFVETRSTRAVVALFQEITDAVEQQRGIRDYHLKITDHSRGRSSGGFLIEIFFGEERPGPDAIPRERCISCNADAVLEFDNANAAEVVRSGECYLEELCERPLVLCSIDAKARPGFVITPVRHEERLSGLAEDELFWLWFAAVRALRKLGLPEFRSMLLHQGSYRHLPHLHLKIRVPDSAFGRVLARWSDERRRVWNRLLRSAFASEPPNMVAVHKERRPCIFFRRNGHCKYADNCRFLH